MRRLRSLPRLEREEGASEAKRPTSAKAKDDFSNVSDERRTGGLKPPVSLDAATAGKTVLSAERRSTAGDQLPDGAKLCALHQPAYAWSPLASHLQATQQTSTAAHTGEWDCLQHHLPHMPAWSSMHRMALYRQPLLTTTHLCGSALCRCLLAHV